MTLLNPAALWLLALAVPVVALYVLRLQRPDRPISSTLLWRHMVDDMQANAPWQRLRLNLLLALQLLALAALVLTMAQPAFGRTHAFAGDLILILDESYSMQTHDVSPSRFAAAQARARALARDVIAGSGGPGLGSGDALGMVSVIGMGRVPRLAIAASQDSSAVDRAIAGLQTGTATPNVVAALSLAASLSRPDQTTRAVLLTDRSSGLDALPLPLSFPVDVIRLGGMRRDLGIISFAAGPGTHTHAVLRLRNLGHDTARSDVELYADGRLTDVRPVTAGPGQTLSAAWDHLPGNVHALQAHLTLRDDMPADKAAWAVVPVPVQRRVLLVSSGNYFLETALALDPAVSLRLMAPVSYTSQAAQGFDVVIFDGVLPPSLPPTSALLVGPPAGALTGINVGAPRRAGGVSAVAGPNASVMRYVDLHDVHVARARSISLPAWLHPLVRSGRTVLVAAGDGGTTRLAVITFRLQESDWPLRISFPIFVHNVMDFLAPGTTLGASGITAGQPISLYASPATALIRIERPDGTVDSIHPPFAPYTDTALPGIYRVRASPNGLQLQFAVNTFSPQRGDRRAPAVSHLGHFGRTATREVSIPASAAWAAGILALGLLTLEWWAALRR